MDSAAVQQHILIKGYCLRKGTETQEHLFYVTERQVKPVGLYGTRTWGPVHTNGSFRMGQSLCHPG